jgi:hypothetical protein
LYCANILEEFEINKNYTDQEFGPEKKFVTNYNNNNIIQVVELKGTRPKCSVETTYGINSVISKLMTFVKNAETGQFLFLIVLILSCFTCS